jgi:putative glutamine amidotransferase
MRPLIGIPCYATESAIHQRSVWAANRSFVRAIEEAGGVPLLVPGVELAASVAALRGRLDGLLFTGGGDVDPARYGEAAIPQCQPPDTARDTLELALARQAVADRLPILGVCRGMQMLNVACGGTLYQDIDVQLPGAQRHDRYTLPPPEQTHALAVEPGTRLARILGVRRHTVNSFHHQAVKEPGRGIAVAARAPDGVAEAIEVREHPFALAVQFHPELQYQADPRLRRLFEAFVRACAAHLRGTADGRAVAAGMGA